ncbi:hypothetical protein TrRE_jg492, partial [Triparma retinervis]
MKGGEEGKGRKEEREGEGKSGGGKKAIDELFNTKKKRTAAAAAAVEQEESRKEEEHRSKKKKLKGDREDVRGLTSGEWIDDGRGGVFNKDGFTGRRDEGGRKIFKAHLFNKTDFGNTPD